MNRTSETHLSTEAPLVQVLYHIRNALALLQISTRGPFLDFLLKTKPNCAKKFVCKGDTPEVQVGWSKVKSVTLNIGYLMLRLLRLSISRTLPRSLYSTGTPQAKTELWLFFPPSTFLLSSFSPTPSLLRFTLENFKLPPFCFAK